MVFITKESFQVRDLINVNTHTHEDSIVLKRGKRAGSFAIKLLLRKLIFLSALQNVPKNGTGWWCCLSLCLSPLVSQNRNNRIAFWETQASQQCCLFDRKGPAHTVKTWFLCLQCPRPVYDMQLKMLKTSSLSPVWAFSKA